MHRAVRKAESNYGAGDHSRNMFENFGVLRSISEHFLKMLVYFDQYWNIFENFGVLRSIAQARKAQSLNVTRSTLTTTIITVHMIII